VSPTPLPIERTVRAAFVGLGRIYDLNVLAYRDNPDVEVVALVDPNPDRLAQRREDWPAARGFRSVEELAASGLQVDAVEALLANGARPAFIYTVPDGHNPLALSMPQEKRVRLAELARRYGVPIVEDDPYGLLAYDGPPAHPIRALEREWVFYVGSFSKVLAPALRLGWLMVPEQLVPLLAISKEESDINTATFSQRAASRNLEGG